MSFGKAMRCRVRYFSDGVTMGSRVLVDQVFKQARDRFGEKRTTGARPMLRVGWKQPTLSLMSL